MAQSWQLSSRSCQMGCEMSKNTIRPSVRREREREGRKSGDQVAEKRAPPGQSMLQGNAINTNTNTITKERQNLFDILHVVTL